MSIYSPLTLTWTNGFLLIIPMLVLRYGIRALVRRSAMAEVDFFPPVEGIEKLALKVYFITSTFLVFSPLISAIGFGTRLAPAGWTIYGLGLLLMTVSLLDYCRTEGLSKRGIYRLSRNPMCIGYFLIYTGVSLLLGSRVHLGIAIIYQLSVHWLILSEERWCVLNFGDDYGTYCKQVRRYF